jgi:hypothetical protein
MVFSSENRRFEMNRWKLIAVFVTMAFVLSTKPSNSIASQGEEVPDEVYWKLESDAESLLTFFDERPSLQGGFGGVYLDHTDRVELVLQLVRSHEKVNIIPAMLPPLKAPDRRRIELVNFSKQHLELQNRIIADVAFDYPLMEAVFIDRKMNRVVAMISPSDEWKTVNKAIEKTSLPKDLAILLADPAVIIFEGKAEEIPNAVRGGDSWSNVSGGANCTLGFEVIYNSKNSMVTAGHCPSALGMVSGDKVYNRTTQIGTFTGRSKEGCGTNSGETCVDAAIHYMNNASTATDDIIHAGQYLDIYSATSSYTTGVRRCFSGKSSGTRCGTITCDSINYKYEQTGRWFRDMFTIDPNSAWGDSGSPVYRVNSDNTASVTGIVRSRISGLSCMNGWDTSSSKWWRIRDLYTLTLVTSD